MGSRGQAQAAAPLQRNSAKLHSKSTARHQSIGTGDKPIHSVERAALRPGIALIKGKLSWALYFLQRAQRRLKRTCIDFTLISLYVKTFEGDQVVCFFLCKKTTTSDPSRRVSLGDTLCSCQKNPQKTSPWRKFGEDLSKDDSKSKVNHTVRTLKSTTVSSGDHPKHKHLATWLTLPVVIR